MLQRYLTAITKVIKRPSFWFILLLMLLITYLHYDNTFERPTFLSRLLTDLGLTRHAFERILYLAPIILAGFLFGWVGGVITSITALAVMLPRAILVSDYVMDSLFETGSIFIIGNVFAMTFNTLRNEKKYRKQLEEAQEKMRFYLGEVNKAQEEERKRISQELHDDTIQSLVVLSRGLDLLVSTGAGLSHDEYVHRIEKLRQLTNDTMTGIRRLSQDLRPAALDRLGLVSALESLAEDITKYWGIQIKVTVNGELHRLNADKELAIFRIVQEALRNVWRHSKATKAEVTIQSDGKTIIIIVSDNGQGFEMPKDISNLPSSGKLGMAGMRDRAQLIGAILKIESTVGQGTKVSIKADIP